MGGQGYGAQRGTWLTPRDTWPPTCKDRRPPTSAPCWQSQQEVGGKGAQPWDRGSEGGGWPRGQVGSSLVSGGPHAPWLQ